MTASGSSEVYRHLLDCLDQGRRVALINRMPGLSLWIEGGAGDFHSELADGDPLAQQARSAIVAGRPSLCNGPQGAFIEPFWPEPRLIILGGGHIAIPLAEMAALLGFAVTVVDDRPSFANRSRFPAASSVICDAFERAAATIPITKWTFVVIATRGHVHDLVCLRECLKHETAYLGMVASRRRTREIRTLLEAEGYAVDQLDRLHAPVGLNIGAVTPEEIAVSILSEMIAARRLGRSWPQFDRKLLAALAASDADPRASITVISTRGSAPRQAGARMIVWPDGRALGSIGGGCIEAEAARLARDVALGGNRVRRLCDLAADAATGEGMACGGVMEILIEPI